MYTVTTVFEGCSITFHTQHLPEGIGVHVFAHFHERDAERVYTSYTMRGLRAGQPPQDISWPIHVNKFIKRYLTDDVIGEAYDVVAKTPQDGERIRRSIVVRGVLMHGSVHRTTTRALFRSPVSPGDPSRRG